MSLKQLMAATLTLLIVASAYAWPSVSQTAAWVIDLVLQQLPDIKAIL